MGIEGIKENTVYTEQVVVEIRCDISGCTNKQRIVDESSQTIQRMLYREGWAVDLLRGKHVCPECSNKYKEYTRPKL